MARPPDPRSGLDEQGRFEPRFPGQRPPFAAGNEHVFEEGNEVPVTHGAYAERRLLEVTEAEYVALRSTFTPWDPAFEMPARQLARIQARTVLAYRYLDLVDLVDDQDQVRAILKELPRWEREATRLYRELAMTVRSRAELELLEAEAGMLSRVEVEQLEAAYRDAVMAVVPEELRGPFLQELRRRVEQLRAADDEGAIEGSARRLGPGPLVDEEGLGGA